MGEMGEMGEKPTALYRFFGTDDQLLYVGISHRLNGRLSAHKRDKPWREVARIELKHYSTRDQAIEAERQAIQTEKPAWNVVHNSVGPEGRPKGWVSLPEHGGWYAPANPLAGHGYTARCAAHPDVVDELPYVNRWDDRLCPSPNPEFVRDGKAWKWLGWLLLVECGCGRHSTYPVGKPEVVRIGRLAGGFVPGGFA